MSHSLLIGIALFLSGGIVYSQHDSLWLEEKYSNELEMISPEEEEISMIDYLEEIIENPVNINTADLNDLTKIPGINSSDAAKILEYRKRTGHIFSLFELYSIPGIDAQSIKNYLPYLSITDILVLNNDRSELPDNTFTTDFRSRVISGLQQRQGYLNNIYQGNSYKIYNRFKLKHEKGYLFGMLTEKDAGEKDYLDHTAFYFQMKDMGIIKSFLAGDYNIEFGKGLAIWSQYGFSKGPSALTGDRNNRNIVPYLSSDEGHFLRGTAINISYKNFDLTAFYSNRMKDARIDKIDNRILSLPSDGYHRTENESVVKSSVVEKVSGARFRYSSNYIAAGLLFYNLSYDHSFSIDDKFPSGTNFNHISFSYNFSLLKLAFSGEISFFRNTMAYLNSVNFSISDNIKVFFHIAKYS